jgi:tetratricopeptide (TPR) repeat protein
MPTSASFVESKAGDDAATLYERALLYKPTYAKAHNDPGNVLKQLGKVDAALACCQRALELKPDFVEAHDNIGILLLERGSPCDALSYFERALAYRPDHAPAHSHRGNALKELGESTEAVAGGDSGTSGNYRFADDGCIPVRRTFGRVGSPGALP